MPLTSPVVYLPTILYPSRPNFHKSMVICPELQPSQTHMQRLPTSMYLGFFGVYRSNYVLYTLHGYYPSQILILDARVKSPIHIKLMPSIMYRRLSSSKPTGSSGAPPTHRNMTHLVMHCRILSLLKDSLHFPSLGLVGMSYQCSPMRTKASHVTFSKLKRSPAGRPHSHQSPENMSTSCHNRPA